MSRQTYLNDGGSRQKTTIEPERAIQNRSSKSHSANPEHTKTYSNMRTTGKHVLFSLSNTITNPSIILSATYIINCE